MSVQQPAQPCCQNCGTTRGRVREVRVRNPNGTVTTCEDCEDELAAEIVEVVER